MQETRFAGHGLHRELAAYHEAAHAVIALHYGRVIMEARISHHLPGNGWVKWMRTLFPDGKDQIVPKNGSSRLGRTRCQGCFSARWREAR